MLPQDDYLNRMFAERRDPLSTRLYYAFCADEVKRMLAAKRDYEDESLQVRGFIYDGIITEGVSVELNETHGLIEKSMPRWEDNVFMCLRKVATRTSIQIGWRANVYCCFLSQHWLF